MSRRPTAPAMTLAIVGVDYPNKHGPARRFELEICRPGEPIELRHEPNNRYDEHAVAVFSARGIQLGYIPSVRAVRVAQLMRQGSDIRAIFQAHARWGGLIRVSFDGNDPDLPPDFSDGESQQDWWPDDEWPDC